jgi:hypothetical protein
MSNFTIPTIFEGMSPSSQFAQEGQFLNSIAIDPDAPITDGSADLLPSGSIRPIGYEKFSGANLNATPLWIETTPKNTNVYIYLNDGKIISYDSTLETETLLRTVAASSGNGFAYYNNYLYYARNLDIGRYGPLNGTPAFTDDFWTSTLSLTALTNPTYPETRNSVKYPNHPMKIHVDNKLYIADVASGRGVLHAIKTKQTTYQGDTNDGSLYNVLDFPLDYYPMCIESYGENLAIGCSFGTSNSINQGSSALFIWDTISDSFSRIIVVPDQIITALKYQNGILYGWSSNLKGGSRFWIYIGGDQIQTLKYIPDCTAPLAGAITADSNRIMWGGYTLNPTNSASVFAFGSKSDLFPRGLHNIARSTVTATTSNGIVTCLKNVLQDNKPHPNLIIGATDGTNTNLDKRSTTYQTSVIRSRLYQIGTPFRITQLKIPLAQAIAANMTITPKLYFDNGSSSKTGTIINNTNYSGKRIITMNQSNFENSTSGDSDFYLELTMSGTTLSTVNLPIEIGIELDEHL